MVPPEPSEFQACAVCARTILRGERVSEYLTPDGERVSVCALCKPRAEASGWTPAGLAGAASIGGEPRRRRRIKFRERLVRVSEAAGAAGARRRRPESEEAEEPVSPPPTPSGNASPRPTPERAMRAAVRAFNASPAARTVSGLRRSLGEPRAAVRIADAGAVLVTVAWELSWYQWEVTESGAVNEVGKGDEVGELPEDDRAWNSSLDAEGGLRLAAERSREQVEG